MTKNTFSAWVLYTSKGVDRAMELTGNIVNVLVFALMIASKGVSSFIGKVASVRRCICA